MFLPRILINKKEVIAHGTLVSKGNQPIEIFPFPAPVNNYVVKITFESKPGEATVVNYGLLGTIGYQLNLVNFDSATVGGHLSPIYVAKHQGRMVMLSLATEIVGQSESATRVVHYTFFDGGAEV